jgi:hypothetical protein
VKRDRWSNKGKSVVRILLNSKTDPITSPAIAPIISTSSDSKQKDFFFRISYYTVPVFRQLPPAARGKIRLSNIPIWQGNRIIFIELE